MNPEKVSILISPGASGKADTPKLKRLAEVARSKGLDVEILNCERVPDPDDRVDGVISKMKGLDHVVLAGSSMGGYVSAVAAESVAVDGLFLLSPVLYLEPYRNLDPQPKASSIAVVHGWDDGIVSSESICRFARRFKVTVHFLPGDHSLHNQVDSVGSFFGLFLEGILKRTKAQPGGADNEDSPALHPHV